MRFLESLEFFSDLNWDAKIPPLARKFITLEVVGSRLFSPTTIHAEYLFNDRKKISLFKSDYPIFMYKKEKITPNEWIDYLSTSDRRRVLFNLDLFE